MVAGLGSRPGHRRALPASSRRRLRRRTAPVGLRPQPEVEGLTALDLAGGVSHEYCDDSPDVLRFFAISRASRL